MTKGWGRKKRVFGFTIIEVMIFLAISGVLIIGIIAGAGATVARYRYNDAVQDLAEFLRSQYSTVVNPQIPERELAALCTSTIGPPQFSDFFVPSGNGQYKGFQEAVYKSLFSNGQFVGSSGDMGANIGRGRTNCAVYGVILTIGSGSSAISTRPLIGKDFAEIERDYDGATPFAQLSDIDLLSRAGIAGDNVRLIVEAKNQNNIPVYNPNAGNNPDEQEINRFACAIGFAPPPQTASSRSLRWDAKMENVNPDDDVSLTLLIFRSPRNGTVRTYVLDGELSTGTFTLNGREWSTGDPAARFWIGNSGGGACAGNLASGGQITESNLSDIYNQISISNKLAETPHDIRDVIICVARPDLFMPDPNRRMIRIVADGHNSSAVELVDMDSVFDPNTNPGGNRCNI
ncbi:prepilin-type N-terminal cleavage/methylation domain-containing protein [Candidatus Saccharibacteria bacterium]|nr:prepilin-type N-terminal cleavage/methylation domain-containing protein [Candidatus Saccharibacteria bacterium]